MFGSPAAARKVGGQIQVADDLVGHGAGLDLAGPAHHGRNPEGALPVGVLLLRKGVVSAASGQEFMCGPLSVLYMTMVLSAMPRSSSCFSRAPHAFIVVDHDVMVFRLPAAGLAQALGLGVDPKVHVQCEPHKKRLIGLGLAVDISVAASRTSSSMVSIRFLVNWPVSSDAAVEQKQRSTPRGP